MVGGTVVVAFSGWEVGQWWLRFVGHGHGRGRGRRGILWTCEILVDCKYWICILDR